MLHVKNLRRAVFVGTLAPALVFGAPAVATTHVNPAQGSSGQTAYGSVGGEGILSDRVTIEAGLSDRDSENRRDRGERRDGILSHLVTIEAGSSERDSENRRDRGERRDGILSHLVTINGSGLLSGNDDADGSGLLGVDIL